MLLGTVRALLPAVLLNATQGLGWSLRMRGKRKLCINLPSLRKACEASRHAWCSAQQKGGEMHLCQTLVVSKPQCQHAWGSAPGLSVLGPLCAPQLTECPLLLRNRKASFTTFLLISYFTVSASPSALWKNSWITRWFSHLSCVFWGEVLLQNSSLCMAL